MPGVRRVEHARRGGPAGPRGASGGGSDAARRAQPTRPVALRDVAAAEHDRLSTGIGELDNVLGGGIVPGSLVLIGGAPGIGKSTLTTMALANLVAAGPPDALRLRRGVGGADPAARRAAAPGSRARASR